VGTTTMWRVLVVSKVILFTTAWYLCARFDRTAYSVKCPLFRFFRSQGLRQFSQGCLYRLPPCLPGHRRAVSPRGVVCGVQERCNVMLLNDFFCTFHS